MGAYKTVILQVEQDSDDDHPVDWNWRDALDEHDYYSQENQSTVYTTVEPVIVIWGNPVDGFNYKVAYNRQEAINWAEGGLDGDWWIKESEGLIDP